jgi:hypothetical protein
MSTSVGKPVAIGPGECLRMADAVEKGFQGYQTRFSKAADAFCAPRREGPHRILEKRPRRGAHDRWCTMREEFASYSFLAVTVVGLVLLCSGLIAFALT